MSSPFVAAHLATGDLSSVAVRISPLGGGKGLQAELNQIRKEERERGFAEGKAEGREAGFAAGHEDGYLDGQQAADEEAAKQKSEQDRLLALELQALRDRMMGAWNTFVAQAHEEMASRAMDVTREVLAQELRLSREGALAIVRRCLHEVPHGRDLRIRVSPDDLPELRSRCEEIRTHLDGRAVEFVEDLSIQAGCVIESSGGRVDGQVATALALIENEMRKAA